MTRALRFLAAVLAFWACGGTAAAAAETSPSTGPSSPTRYRADRLLDRVVDGQPITHLYGNVLIVRDTMTVAADSALFYREDDEYDFFGNVRMTRGAAVLTCRAAFYNDRTMDADFEGDVRMVDGDVVATGVRAEMREEGDLTRLIRDARVVSPDYVVHADTVVNREGSSEGEAFGHVVMVDPGGGSVVHGGHAVFARDGGRVTVDRRPRLESRERGDEPLVADALLMDFFRDRDLVVMTDSVRIRQGRTVAVGDTARVYGRERLRLTGAPVMEDGEGSTFRAEAIETWYRDSRPVYMRLEGSALVEDSEPGGLAELYSGLPELDTLSGDTISVTMKDGRPSRSLVVGDARSVYVPADAVKEIAFNDVRGDTILIAFADPGVDQVDVRGSMTGTYSFMRLDEVGTLAAAAAAELDSVLAARGEEFAALLPDSLAAALPDSSGGWPDLDPNLGGALAAALVDSLAARGDSTLVLTVRRALAPLLAGETSDGRRTVDFTANREFVDYRGGEGIFQLADRRILLRNDANLVYGSIDLTAQDIRLETRTRELYAEGTPLLVDGGEKIAGRRMGYDFGNRTGAVKDGVTAMDGYYYVGKHIKRFGDGDLKIRSGKMTSCDLDRPHYHFWADKMKIKMGDKVVAKPIVLKIGEVPIFALPFYFKSLKSGRRSGIIFPSFDFGWSSRTGRYIRNWGYYWATNDYTDFTFQGDYNERRELTWQINNRYAKRYAFDGNIRYSRRTTLSGDPITRQWQFHWDHDQPALFDAYRVSAKVDMSSSTIDRTDLLNDVGEEVINSRQWSSVSVSRSWKSVSASLGFRRDENVNAEDDDLQTNEELSTQQFPQLSLSFSNRTLGRTLRPGEKGSLLGDLLRNTHFGHSYSLRRTVTNRETTRRTLDNAQGSASLKLRPPRLWIFNVNTGASAALNWSRDEITGETYDEEGEPVSAAQEVEQSRKTLTTSTTVGTTLYGLFRPRIGSLRGIRHTLKLSSTYSWRPEIVGTQSADQNVTLSVSNRFDLKFRDASSDSAETYRKLDGVVDWSLNTSYDPDKTRDTRWSTLRSSVTVQPGRNRNLRVRLGSSYDPYELRVLTTDLSYGLNFSGKFDTGAAAREEEAQRNEAIAVLGVDADSTATAPVLEEEDDWSDPEDERDLRDDFGGYGIFADEPGDNGRDDTEGGRFIPWRLGSSFTYRKDHKTDELRALANLNAALTLTRTWSATWRAGYDLETGAFTNQSWSLQKDLHCWTMRFSRTISTSNRSFGFIISLRAIPDLKFTRGRENMVGGGLSSLGRRY